MSSICPAYVETCSGSVIQNGSAPAADGRSAPPKTESAGRRTRTARGNPKGLVTASRLSELSLERKIDGLRLGAGHRHVLSLRAVLLVPCLDDVVARREILDLEDPLVVRRGEEGVVEDAGVGAHPLVDVALEPDGHLRRVELLDRLH